MFSDKNILKLLDGYNNIILTGHQNPDGDSIGACFGMAGLLKKCGKNPQVILEPYIKKYSIIPGKEFLFEGDVNDLQPEVFITLDCGSKERFLWLKGLHEKAKLTINIDHHTSNDNFSDYNFVDSNSVSTCEIVYELFNGLVDFDKEVAAALYAGLIFDSGGLRFRNVTKKTMLIAGELMDTGIDFPAIYSEIMLKRTTDEITAIKKAWENLSLDLEKGISMTTITIAEMEELGITNKDLEGIVQMIMNIENIYIAVFIYEAEPELFKVSLRSVYLDVNKIASQFDGGGHINAAGCKISGSLSDVKQKIIKAIECGLNG